MYEFIVLALITGIAVAIAAGPLGSFIVWKKLAYFGDTVAHSALLGVAASIIFDINLLIGVLFTSACISILLVLTQQESSLSDDTILGVLSHSALAIGLVALSLSDKGSIDLHQYLIGDILTVQLRDVTMIVGFCCVLIFLIVVFWRPLLATTVHAALAQSEGIPAFRFRLLLALMIALLVSTAIKVVGVLLIGALLILPAATARQLASTPEKMAVLASIVGVFAVCLGMLLSFKIDTPTGPSIVLSATLLFLFALATRILMGRNG